MRSYPYIKLPHAIVVLRVAVAIFFMAHAGMRIYNGSIPQFASFLSGKGFPMSTAIVWLISLYELIAGSLMMLGFAAKWMAAGLFFIAFMGIVLIHFQFGWFVGEHGTGGMEYSFSLMVSLLVIAAADQAREDQIQVT